MPADSEQTDREHESEALKIADSIGESAKSAAGDLQKTQARRDGKPEHLETAHHFVRSFWRLRFSWAANGTPVVQRRR